LLPLRPDVPRGRSWTNCVPSGIRGCSTSRRDATRRPKSRHEPSAPGYTSRRSRPIGPSRPSRLRIFPSRCQRPSGPQTCGEAPMAWPYTSPLQNWWAEQDARSVRWFTYRLDEVLATAAAVRSAVHANPIGLAAWCDVVRPSRRVSRAGFRARRLASDLRRLRTMAAVAQGKRMYRLGSTKLPRTSILTDASTTDSGSMSVRSEADAV
jgi:hypothetical protein